MSKATIARRISVLVLACAGFLVPAPTAWAEQSADEPQQPCPEGQKRHRTRCQPPCPDHQTRSKSGYCSYNPFVDDTPSTGIPNPTNPRLPGT